MYTFPTTGDYEGDLVLDPFAGWGTTCVAAKRQGRRYTGIDLSQSFCEEARERLEKVTLEPSVMGATKPKERK
jgi:DNA modification methylase